MRARTRCLLIATAGLSVGLLRCGSSDEPGGGEPTGSATVELTRAPSDARCVRVSVQGSSRTVTKFFDVFTGDSTSFRIDRLPIGVASFQADAFPDACSAVTGGSIPNWSSDPQSGQIRS